MLCSKIFCSNLPKNSINLHFDIYKLLCQRKCLKVIAAVPIRQSSSRFHCEKEFSNLVFHCKPRIECKQPLLTLSSQLFFSANEESYACRSFFCFSCSLTLSNRYITTSSITNCDKIDKRHPNVTPVITHFDNTDSKCNQATSKENLNPNSAVAKLKKDFSNLLQLIYKLRGGDSRSLDDASLDTKAEDKNVAGPVPRGPVSTGAAEKVVFAAVAINSVNFLLKFMAWMYTGSASLFAEALHSLADTSNQLILAYGIHKSSQRADSEHPYGYSNMPHVSSLISGAMIFCLGAGVSVHHGIAGLISPPEVVPLYWAFFILGGSLLTEGGTLIMAIHAIRKGALQQNMSFAEYVMQGEDPSVNVVLFEDTAAVLGVGVALSCLALTSILGTSTPDALGSCIIGGLLAGVAGFIIRSNIGPLVGRSIPQDELQHMNRIMEQDVMIRALHDVKGMDMGTGLVRYKAEVDFDGRELTRAYLERQNIEEILEQMNHLKTPEDAQDFLLNFGENVIDTLGAEIDRIEQSLKKAHPEVRHCDLEIL